MRLARKNLTACCDIHLDSASAYLTKSDYYSKRLSALVRILLQKSKVASVRIFGETLKHEAIDDSDNFSRATEVAYQFSLRGAKRLLQHYRAHNGL
jgi:hypothetical protein